MSVVAKKPLLEWSRISIFLYVGALYFAVYAVSQTKLIDFFLSWVWFSVTWAACRSLVNFFSASRRLLVTSFAVFWGIFFSDFTLKGFLKTNWGQNYDSRAILTSLSESHSGEVVAFLTQYGRSAAFFVCLFLLGHLLGCFIYSKLLRAQDEQAAARKAEKKHAFPKVVPPPKKNLLTRVKKLVQSNFFFPVLWVLLHFQPHTNAEPFAFYIVVFQEYQQARELVKSYDKVLAQKSNQINQQRILTQNTGPKTLVLVIGESATSLNWGVNGYARDTTPKVSALLQQTNSCWSIQPVVAPSGYTVPVFQQMFFFGQQNSQSSWQTSPNFIALSQKAGFKVFWLSNQLGVGTHDNFIFSLAKQADHYRFFNKQSYFKAATYDEVLLPSLTEALSDPASKKLIVLHFLGSHFDYQNRYPQSFDTFNDDTDLTDVLPLEWAQDSQMIANRNHYDNSILYTDFLLQQVIEQVNTYGQSNSAVLYFSDHGQEVGHSERRAGHSGQTAAGITVPFLVCLQENFFSQRPFFFQKAETASHQSHIVKNRPYLLTNLAHTLLGMLEINYLGVYEPTKDLFAKEYIVPNL